MKKLLFIICIAFTACQNEAAKISEVKSTYTVIRKYVDEIEDLKHKHKSVMTEDSDRPMIAEQIRQKTDQYKTVKELYIEQVAEIEQPQRDSLLLQVAAIDAVYFND